MRFVRITSGTRRSSAAWRRKVPPVSCANALAFFRGPLILAGWTPRNPVSPTCIASTRRTPSSVPRERCRRITGATPERQSELRRFVDQRAMERLPACAKHYASSAQIPLEFLPFFDLVEKRAPWDARAGYASLFALLDKKNIAWHQCAWPETNRLAQHTDEAIVRHTLAELRPEHRFACVHLQELDGTGHVHGPNSAAF